MNESGGGLWIEAKHGRWLNDGDGTFTARSGAREPLIK